jgi:hypothetical protein
MQPDSGLGNSGVDATDLPNAVCDGIQENHAAGVIFKTGSFGRLPLFQGARLRVLHVAVKPGQRFPHQVHERLAGPVAVALVGQHD